MIMCLKIERIFIKFDAFVPIPLTSLLLYLVPDHYHKNVPMRQSFSWKTTWESTTFHGCQGLENMTFWKEAVTPWIPADRSRGLGAAKAGGTRLPEPNSSPDGFHLRVYEISPTPIVERLSRELTETWKLLSLDSHSVRKLAAGGSGRHWGWWAELSCASLGPDSERIGISRYLLTGLKDLAWVVLEWETLTVISLLLYHFEG